MNKKKFDESKFKRPVTFKERFTDFFFHHFIKISVCIGVTIVVICAFIFKPDVIQGSDEGKISNINSKAQRDISGLTVTSNITGTESQEDNSWIEELQSSEHFKVSTDSSGNTNIEFEVSDIPSSPPDTTSNTVTSDTIPTSGPSVIFPPSSSEPEEPSTIPVNPNHPTSRPTIPPNYDDPWLYPYDVDKILEECKAYADSVGIMWEESLDKSNSHWTTPSSTVPFTTGEAGSYGVHLRDDTFKAIKYYSSERWPDTGEKVFTFIKLYFEPHPVYEGDYLVYYLLA